MCEILSILHSKLIAREIVNVIQPAELLEEKKIHGYILINQF